MQIEDPAVRKFLTQLASILPPHLEVSKFSFQPFGTREETEVEFESFRSLTIIRTVNTRKPVMSSKGGDAVMVVGPNK